MSHKSADIDYAQADHLADYLLGQRTDPPKAIYKPMEVKMPIKTLPNLFKGWDKEMQKFPTQGSRKKIEVTEIITGEEGYGTGYEVHVDTEADRAFVNLKEPF